MDKKDTPKKKKYGYWYEIHCQECPVCGNVKEYRVRKYSDRPEIASKRYFYEQIYDWCEKY